MDVRTDPRTNGQGDGQTLVREIGHDAVQRALTDTAADLAPAQQPADVVTATAREAGAVMAPAIAPGDAEQQAEAPSKAKQRIERLLGLRDGVARLVKKLEDVRVSAVDGKIVPTRLNGETRAPAPHQRFIPAFDKLVEGIEADLLRAAGLVDELDENL